MASFASAGLRPAWNRGRPASSRSSSESSRATSRSRSRTQDAWGGDRASTDKSTDPPLLEIPPGGHRKLLPWNNKDPALEARFAYWTQQKEAGPAELFAAAYKSIIKTQAKEDAAMCYNEITGIWERKDFDEWMIWFQRWCRDELQHLADDVDTASRFSEGDPVSIGEDGEKIILAAKKAWVAAQRTITATIDHLGKRAGMVSGAKLAAVHLRDDKFFRSLDSARNGVSFANGIVNLCDGSLTPRIANLDIPWSYALDYDYDPRADQTDIRAYIHSLFDDLESEHTMQVHVYRKHYIQRLLPVCRTIVPWQVCLSSDPQECHGTSCKHGGGSSCRIWTAHQLRDYLRDCTETPPPGARDYLRRVQQQNGPQ